MENSESQVSKQMSDLSDTVERIRSLAGGFESELRSVLRPEKEECAEDSKPAPAPKLVPLADELNTISRVALNIEESLRGILSRIEL